MDYVEILQQKGLRPTPHRVRIAQKVLKEHCHFTAEEVSDWANGLKQRLSRATIYNILNEFVAVGLLRLMHLPSVGKTIYDSNTGTHFHFYDVHTGDIHDVEPSKVKMDLDSLKGFKVEEVTVLMTGRKC